MSHLKLRKIKPEDGIRRGDRPGVWLTQDGRFCIQRQDNTRRHWYLYPVRDNDHAGWEIMDQAGLLPGQGRIRGFETRREAVAVLSTALSLDSHVG